METNKIYNVDFKEYIKNIKDKSIDLVVTDPPYKTTKRGISKNTTTGGIVRSEEGKSGKMFKFNNIKPIEYIKELYRVLKDGSHCYIMTNHINLQEILNTATDCGFHFIKSLIWNKGNKIMGQSYMSQFEYILFFRKGKHKKINNCGTSDIINIQNIKTKNNNGENIHPTEKPVELMKILIENSSKEGEIVVDPFIGVGSTALACLMSNRKYIGFELDEKYYNTCIERIDNYELSTM